MMSTSTPLLAVLLLDGRVACFSQDTPNGWRPEPLHGEAWLRLSGPGALTRALQELGDRLNHSDQLAGFALQLVYAQADQTWLPDLAPALAAVQCTRWQVLQWETLRDRAVQLAGRAPAEAPPERTWLQQNLLPVLEAGCAYRDDALAAERTRADTLSGLQQQAIGEPIPERTGRFPTQHTHTYVRVGVAEELKPDATKVTTSNSFEVEETFQEFMDKDKHSIPYFGKNITHYTPVESYAKQITELKSENINDIEKEGLYLHKSVLAKNSLQEFFFRCQLENHSKRNTKGESKLLTRYIGIVTNPFFGKNISKENLEKLVSCESVACIVRMVNYLCRKIEDTNTTAEVNEQLAFISFIDKWLTKEFNHFLSTSAKTSWSVDSITNDWESLCSLLDYNKEEELSLALEAFSVRLIQNMRKAYDVLDIAECVSVQNDIDEDIPIGALPYWVTNTQLHIIDAMFSTGMKVGDMRHVTVNDSPIVLSICKSLKVTFEQLEVKPLHNYISTMDGSCYEIIQDAYNPENYYIKRVE